MYRCFANVVANVQAGEENVGCVTCYARENQNDRVGVTKLRSLPLPHHRTYGFPYPAVESESLCSQ